ncbi:MAG: DEAD/DEAH box helicase family protein [Planctomycetota bacterium]|nr:DEAD/DEAH box helicase family protein [Planctomycetota bacterium]
MITLRPYQEDVKTAVYDHLRSRDDNPCAVVPTAGGKTPIMASICKDAVGLWGGRVLILAHVKELLEQTADKLKVVCPEIGFGIYSAGLKRRDTQNPVIVASIQSVYKRACELDAFNLIMVDEAHLIPLEGDGMYRQFLADAKVINPELRIIGFTATPYRLKTGPICTPDSFLNHICYEVGVRELIRDGFLCPLISKAGRAKADMSSLHVRGGEFISDEVESLMDQESLVSSAASEIMEYTADRKACLIFASGVQHGQHIVEVLREEHGVECGFVSGDTPIPERDATLARFKAGELKYLCNVNVLTTGFDAPHIDCVALVRPTMSPGLYYQMVGRGFRLHPSKENCLVLDFGGNVLRHGPVDDIKVTTIDRGDGKAPAKECPSCQAVIAAGFTTCPQCGYVFPPPERQQHDPKASEAGILSGQVSTTKLQVEDVYYGIHTKRGASEDAPRTLRVDYRVGWHDYKSEWVCFEHDGYARQKAIAWWRKRSPDPVPDSVERAIEIIDGGGLATTLAIKVRSVAGDPYERIIDYELGPMPEGVPASEHLEFDPDEIPF